MNKERELLERALQLIDDAYEGKIALSLCNEIKELLAQPEHIVDVTDKVEPVAWMLIDKETGARIPKAYKPEHGVNKDRWELYPLFTRPQKCKFLSVKQVKDLWETTFKSAVPYYTFYEICVAIITALE